ncbi:MAG: hypothetical protein AAFY15_05230, partial [Cyanobacteria bacterium J06648_11]
PQQSFIRENLENMQGSFEQSLAEVYGVSPIGWYSGEISWRTTGAEPASTCLQSLVALDPRRYTFRGTRSNYQDVLYRTQDGREVPIDYKTKILHVVNKGYLSFRKPTGIADCRLAAAAWRAWKLIVAQTVIAGQRQATPIIMGTSPDTLIPLVKANGQPVIGADGLQVRVPATQKMSEALKKLSENANYLSLVEGSDAKVLNAQTNGQFFMDLLDYFQRLMLLAFMVPETLFSVGRGGLGNAGIAESHEKIMRMQLRTITKQIKSQLKEQIIRPLLTWEFGEQESYGNWAEPESHEENRIELFSAITQAIAGGAMSIADMDVINRHRELAGISPVAELPALNLPTYESL